MGFDLMASAVIGVLVLGKHRRALLIIYAAAYAALLGWWFSISPSNDKAWAADVAHPVVGSLEGNLLSVRNVRNFTWRTDQDYIEKWEQRTYDLAQLRSLDLFLVYWMGPSIAHTIMSFGFDDGRHLDFSIELRRAKDDQYSAIEGFFKKHELVYIGADERDLITLRKIRGEQVQLYRLRTPREPARALLLEYIKTANELAVHPRFYNTLTTNCTTTIFSMTRAVTSSMPFDWRIILTGYLPSYLYERGAVDTSIPLEDLRQRADISARIDPDLTEIGFSTRIRDRVPTPH